MDNLGFVQPVNGFGQGLVVAVARTPDRGLDAGLGQALAVANRDVLSAADALLSVKG